MTAFNYLTVSNGVILFSETSIYDPEHRITRFASKIRTPEGGRMGYITSGSAKLGDDLDGWVSEITGRLGAPLTFDSATEVFAGYMSYVRDYLRHLGVDPDTADRAKLVIGFAGWSDKEQRWRGGQLYSWPEVGDAGTVLPIHNNIWPALVINGGARPIEKDEIAENLGRIGVDAFARAVLNLQRRQAILKGTDKEGNAGNCVIGGTAELVAISDAGVSHRVLQEWPDAIGDGQAILRARVAAEPEPLLPFLVSRSERRRRNAEAQKRFSQNMKTLEGNKWSA